MFFVANHILHDEHLSEDAVSEAFFRIARNFHKIDSIESKRTRNFVVIIVKRIAIDFYNREPDEIIITDSQEVYNNINFETSSFDSMDITINELLEMLPEIYRDILYLYYVDGYKINEIAKLLGLTSSTIKKDYREVEIF